MHLRLNLKAEIFLTDRETSPNHEFYYLWNQNENLKLIKGSNDLLNLFYIMLVNCYWDFETCYTTT